MLRLEAEKKTINSKEKPCVLVFGPSLEHGGGVATFVNILLSSPRMQDNYRMIHFDTTRKQKDVGLENRLSPVNLTYLVRQIFRFIGVAVRMRPKIVHFPVTSGLAFWKIATFIFISKIFGMRTVAHVHGGLFDNYFWKTKPFVQRLMGFVFHVSDIVVALSERWRQFLLEEIRSDLRVEVVSNTVDLMFAQHLSQKSNIVLVEEKIILFLGSLGYRKGVFDILQAIPLVVEKHPDVRFLFAGEEETRGEKVQIDQVCQEEGLGEYVRFLGMVTDQAKLELFQHAMVYILPSYGENLPYTLLEAMAVGLPVVTTSVGAIPEIIETYRNGVMIQPGDYEALAKAIIELLDKPELRANMSRANIEAIKKGFLPSVAMMRFDELYRNLVFAN